MTKHGERDQDGPDPARFQGKVISTGRPERPASDPAREHYETRQMKVIRKGMAIAGERRSGEIRDSMREIIENQLSKLKEISKERILGNTEAATLHRVSIVWKSVESANREEAQAQDFSGLSDEELADAATKAERFLKQ